MGIERDSQELQDQARSRAPLERTGEFSQNGNGRFSERDIEAVVDMLKKKGISKDQAIKALLFREGQARFHRAPSDIYKKMKERISAKELVALLIAINPDIDKENILYGKESEEVDVRALIQRTRDEWQRLEILIQENT